MRGNFTNHYKKYARDENLRELQQQFTNFILNDFASLQKEVCGLKTDISWLKKLTIGIIIAIISFALVILLT